jgi:hypothetical protein
VHHNRPYQAVRHVISYVSYHLFHDHPELLFPLGLHVKCCLSIVVFNQLNKFVQLLIVQSYTEGWRILGSEKTALQFFGRDQMDDFVVALGLT